MNKRKPGRPFDERKAQTIFEAATKMFLKHGFAGTSMDEVAKKANVTKQTLYRNFSSKDNLFGRVILEQCNKFSPSKEFLSNLDTEPEKALYEIGIGFLDMITSKEGLALHRLVSGESERKPKIAQIFYDSGPVKMQNLLTGYLKILKKEKGFDIPNIESAASYFYAMLKGRFHLRMMLKVEPQPTRKEIEDHVKETVRIFLKLYSPAKK